MMKEQIKDWLRRDGRELSFCEECKVMIEGFPTIYGRKGFWGDSFCFCSEKCLKTWKNNNVKVKK